MSVIDSGDYGFLVSQLGVDVTKAADQQLITSSSWRNMMIHMTDVVTIANGSTATITHNLGYPAVWIVWQVNASESHVMTTTTSQARMNSTTLQLTNDASLSPLTLRYYIYRIPLNQNFSAPVFKTSTIDAVAKDKDIGIKIVKPGKKYTSTDLRDYTFHSGTRSPMVHTVSYGQSASFSGLDPNGVSRTGNYAKLYVNNLPYVPIFLGFYSGDNTTFTSVVGFEQTNPRLFVFNNGDAWIATSAAGQYGCIVIFKDPYQVGTTQAVTI